MAYCFAEFRLIMCLAQTSEIVNCHFSELSVNIRILGSKWRLSKEGTLALIAAKGLSLFRDTGSLLFGWLAYFGAVSSNVVCENPMALGVGQTPSPPRPRLTGYRLHLVSLPCKIISTSLRLRLSNRLPTLRAIPPPVCRRIQSLDLRTVFTRVFLRRIFFVGKFDSGSQTEIKSPCSSIIFRRSSSGSSAM